MGIIILHDNDHHNNHHGNDNGYDDRYPRPSLLQIQTRADNIHNNKEDNKAHTLVNTHTVRWVRIEPLQFV